MEIWRLLAVIITVGVLACSAQGMSLTLDKEHWISKNWEDKPLVDTLVSEVASLIKRSKAHQFYGLMGKRADIPQRTKLGQKRNKGEKFVGLMGRSLRDTFTRIIPAETSTAMQSDKQSDLQEGWNNPQYY
ncbi:protachykinin isoform X2 [Pangasianodon hypophthalmus]|uniref:protachykinin isoform X2 n=1 Tax=Pangasianodon hypophthalmus TaxID=310915 RepID=UPI0014818340|nr:protachykinin isoform X2 [Pangasianodon hypophthalmus]